MSRSKTIHININFIHFSDKDKFWWLFDSTAQKILKFTKKIILENINSLKVFYKIQEMSTNLKLLQSVQNTNNQELNIQKTCTLDIIKLFQWSLKKKKNDNK